MRKSGLERSVIGREGQRRKSRGNAKSTGKKPGHPAEHSGDRERRLLRERKNLTPFLERRSEVSKPHAAVSSRDGDPEGKGTVNLLNLSVTLRTKKERGMVWYFIAI